MAAVDGMLGQNYVRVEIRCLAKGMTGGSRERGQAPRPDGKKLTERKRRRGPRTGPRQRCRRDRRAADAAQQIAEARYYYCI
jgi:hypothetical protein